MIDKNKLMMLARDWLTAWNSKDIDRLMRHYHDEIEFYSPNVVKRWSKPGGKLLGKDAVRSHLLKGFEDANHIQFHLLGILEGIDGIIIVYKKGIKGMGADLVNLDDEGKVIRVMANTNC